MVLGVSGQYMSPERGPGIWGIFGYPLETFLDGSWDEVVVRVERIVNCLQQYCCIYTGFLWVHKLAGSSKPGEHIFNYDFIVPFLLRLYVLRLLDNALCESIRL